VLTGTLTLFQGTRERRYHVYRPGIEIKSMADPRVRTLKIKTGVVKRLTKEKISYEVESEQQKKRIERMKTEGKDEYDIKKQGEVLQESLMMIPDCQKKLAPAVTELQKILDEEGDMVELEEYKQAVTIVADAKKHLSV